MPTELIKHNTFAGFFFVFASVAYTQLRAQWAFIDTTTINAHDKDINPSYTH